MSIVRSASKNFRYIKNYCPYLILCLLFYPLEGFSFEWKRRATGPTYAEYFGQIERNGEVAAMLMLRDYVSETDFEGYAVKSIQTERLFNCKENITRVRKYSGFSEEMGLGEIVLEKAGGNQWEKVAPSTFLEYALNDACRG